MCIHVTNFCHIQELSSRHLSLSGAVWSYVFLGLFQKPPLLLTFFECSICLWFSSCPTKAACSFRLVRNLGSLEIFVLNMAVQVTGSCSLNKFETAWKETEWSRECLFWLCV